jgi:hypothetical protein
MSAETTTTRRYVKPGHAERKAQPRKPATYRDPQLMRAFAQAQAVAPVVSAAQAKAEIDELFG